MTLRLNSTGGGFIEIDAPNTASNFSLTAPTANGTLDTTGRAGNILQVQQYQRLGVIGSSRSSLAAPSAGAGYVNLMSKSITTTVSNSKILVIAEWNSYQSTRGHFQLKRNGSVISADPYAHYTDTTTEFVNYSTTVVDSPTASAGSTITYAVDVASGSGTILFGYGDSGGGGSTILALVEIAP